MKWVIRRQLDPPHIISPLGLPSLTEEEEVVKRAWSHGILRSGLSETGKIGPAPKPIARTHWRHFEKRTKTRCA